jgi:hypothetical protein
MRRPAIWKEEEVIMHKLLPGIAALALLVMTLPADAAQRSKSSASDLRAQDSARHTAHKQRRRTARRPYARRHYDPYVAALYGRGGGYGGYATPLGDPLGLNPAVEFYRGFGRCIIDEGYGRYTFCDD